MAQTVYPLKLRFRAVQMYAEIRLDYGSDWAAPLAAQGTDSRRGPGEGGATFYAGQQTSHTSIIEGRRLQVSIMMRTANRDLYRRLEGGSHYLAYGRWKAFMPACGRTVEMQMWATGQWNTAAWA
ncbi:hypothetical protein R8Z50_22620 [Longispora sp. K20-0274]|uniref:hypothetical protein n=1 Tax=Longispora sp. K20-0274 TaxID=3088255 RepID=UPI00399B1F30